ncbi:MAG: hypothetical protein DRJ51_04120 [Thermoprotei archaeon]|nr:MAG: hypothetical protein DRJ51_04120 [Thermoprotei archaeon]
MIGSEIYISLREATEADPFSLVAWVAIGLLMTPIAASLDKKNRRIGFLVVNAPVELEFS